MGAITLGLLWSGKLGGGFGQISLWGISFLFARLLHHLLRYYTRLYNL
jgi:hypothetical protein